MIPRNRIIVILIALCIAWGLAPARAQQVLWGSPANRTNLTSEGPGNLLNASFTFQVGAFFEAGVPGWTPSAANTAEWAHHWLAADSAVYNETFRAFTGSCPYDGGFGGRQGFIWGFDDRTSEGEWILLTDPGWFFPSFESSLMFPLSWQTSGATTAIVGTVSNTAGASVHLQTAKIAVSPPPLVPAEQWLGMHFTTAELADSLVSGWESDADADGMSNLLEFALGLLPREAKRDRQPVQGFLESGGFNYLTLRVERSPNAAVIYGAEVSSDLKNWQDGGADVLVLSETPTEVVFRDSLSISESENRFMRLKVTLGQ